MATNDKPDADQLRAVANGHWLAVYEALIGIVGGEWQGFGGVNAFRTPHIPATFANGALVVETGTAQDLAAAVAWVSEVHVPFTIRIETVTGAELLTVPAQIGLVPSAWTLPGMILEPIPDAPHPADGVTTARVTALNHEDFYAPLVESGFPDSIARSTFGPDILELEGIALFVAYLDGRPAGTSIVVQTGDVSGIYTVGVTDWARRRGVGTAVTWAAVNQAREWGSWAVILQSTRMGFGVYKPIGFRTVVEYASFSPEGVSGDE